MRTDMGRSQYVLHTDLLGINSKICTLVVADKLNFSLHSKCKVLSLSSVLASLSDGISLCGASLASDGFFGFRWQLSYSRRYVLKNNHLRQSTKMLSQKL